MTRPWLLGAVLAASLAAPAAAQASNQTITVGTGNQRVVCTTNCATVTPGTPANVVVNAGETVTWSYAADSSQKHHIQSVLQTGSPEIWDFLPGSDPTSGNFLHPFNTTGSFAYHCELHPSDMFGTVRVNNPPTAALTPSTSTPANGASVTFDASGSADTDSPPSLTYEWDLDGNGTFETVGGTTPMIARSFTTAGSATVGVRVTDSDGASTTTQTSVQVAAVPDPGPGPQPQPQPQPQPEPQPAAPDPTPAITAPVVVPIALAANPAPAPAAAPTLTAPKGQKLKRQKGVRVAVSCPGGCALVLNGTVKVGGKRLKLKKVSRSLAAGGSATVTLLVADAKALKKAKGKAQASITAGLTVAGQTSTKNVAVSLTS